MRDLKQLENKIGYKFKSLTILEEAITHSSYANEKHHGSVCNERLEFLGDSVLGLISAEYYFKLFAAKPEGDLTKMRAASVCEESLFGFAKRISLGDYLFLGRGEEHTGGRERPSILADAFEAVIAAIYLDGGFEKAKEFVLPFLLNPPEKDERFKDYKTTLQEIIQQNPEERLEYVLTGEEGPDHDKHFFVEVRLNSNVIGKGQGRSKKHAEQQAAKEALELMGF